MRPSLASTWSRIWSGWHSCWRWPEWTTCSTGSGWRLLRICGKQDRFPEVSKKWWIWPRPGCTSVPLSWKVWILRSLLKHRRSVLPVSFRWEWIGMCEPLIRGYNISTFNAVQCQQKMIIIINFHRKSNQINHWNSEIMYENNKTIWHKILYLFPLHPLTSRFVMSSHPRM